MGSNLKCQKTIELKCFDKEEDSRLHYGFSYSVVNGKKGLCVGGVKPANPREQTYYDFYFFTFELDDDTAKLSGLTYLDNKTGKYGYAPQMTWAPENPDIVWMLKGRAEDLGDGVGKSYCYLVAIKLNEELQRAAEICRLELGNCMSTDTKLYSGYSFVLYKNMIYAYVYDKYLQIDIKNLSNPQKIMEIEGYGSTYGSLFLERGDGGANYQTLELIPDSNLSSQERFNITTGLTLYPLMAIEQNLLVAASKDFIKVYKLHEIKNNKAEFERISYREPTPLERIIQSLPVKVMLKDGLAYVIQERGLGQGLTVFDVTQPGMIRKIGHYKRPEESFHNISFTDDGKVMLLGQNIHILRPPKNANNQK